MSKIRLFIARHGETDYNKRGLLQGRGIDAPLNNKGWCQAELLATYLTGYETDGLVTSSLRRTWQTAEPFRKRNQLDLIKNGGLDEMDFGDLEGASFEEVSEELRDLQKSWKGGDLGRSIPGGESPKEVFARANDTVRSLLESFEGHTMVLILHGRLIRILLSEWLGYGLSNMHKIEHQNGAVNQLVVQHGQFQPVYLNKTAHLKSVNRRMIHGS